MPRLLHFVCALLIFANPLLPFTQAQQTPPQQSAGAADTARAGVSHEALIAALVEAQSEEARAALLSENRELLTEKLLQELNDQGRKAAGVDDYALALKNFAAMLTAARMFGDSVWMSDALNNIGIVHYLRADYDVAMDYYKQALVLREAAGHKSKMASSLFNVATIHRYRGDYAQALDMYLKNLRANEEAGNVPLTAQALLNVGHVYRRTGNYALALNYYGRSLALQEQTGFKQGVADSLTAIGNVYTLQSNFPQALENYRKSLDMHRASGDKRGIQAALGSIGIAYTLQGEHRQALEYLNQSLVLSEAMGYEQGTANTLNNIGESLNALGERARAMEHVRRALRMHEATGDRPGLLVSLVVLANINISLGDFVQGLDFADRAAALAREINDPWMLEQALTAAGLAYRAQGKRPQARRSFEEAVAAIEVVRGQVAGGERDRQRFFENKVTPYAALVEMLVSENDLTEAFASAERGKARVLADVLMWGRVDVTKSMTEGELVTERRLKADIAALNGRVFRERAAGARSLTGDAAAQLAALKSQLAKARLDYESFQTNLYAARPALRVQRGEMRPVRLEQALELLPDEQTAALEFVLTEEKTYLFALARRGPAAPALKVYTLDVGRKALAARADKFRNASGAARLRIPPRRKRVVRATSEARVEGAGGEEISDRRARRRTLEPPFSSPDVCAGSLPRRRLRGLLRALTHRAARDVGAAAQASHVRPSRLAGVAGARQSRARRRDFHTYDGHGIGRNARRAARTAARSRARGRDAARVVRRCAEQDLFRRERHGRAGQVGGPALGRPPSGDARSPRRREPDVFLRRAGAAGRGETRGRIARSMGDDEHGFESRPVRPLGVRDGARACQRGRRRRRDVVGSICRGRADDRREPLEGELVEHHRTHARISSSTEGGRTNGKLAPANVGDESRGAPARVAETT